MKPILCVSKGRTTITIEIVPEGILIGAGHMEPGTPMQAVVCVTYEQAACALVAVLASEMEKQNNAARISIYGDTVQVTLTNSPITPTLRDLLAQNTYLHGFEDKIDAVSIVSMADVAQNDAMFTVFKKCFERDKCTSLLLAESGRVNVDGKNSEPFAVFVVKEIGENFHDTR